MQSHSASQSGLLWLVRQGHRDATALQRTAFFAALMLFSVTLAAALVQVVATWHRLPGPSMDAFPLARRHAAAGDWKRAAAEYRSGYFVNWLARQDISMLATALARAGDSDQLLEVFQRAARLSVQPDVHLNLTGMLLQRGDTRGAVEAMTRFVDLYPTSPRAHLSRAKLFSQLNQPDAALASFERSVQLEPRLVEGWFGVATSHLALRNPHAALEAFQRLIDVNPRVAVAHNGIGSIYLERGDTVRAQEAFRTALQLDPTLEEARHNLERATSSATPQLSANDR